MDGPILFNERNVNAILNGHKDQTRRIAKPQPVDPDNLGDGDTIIDRSRIGTCIMSEEDWRTIGCRWGFPGDVLYVKETHQRYGHWLKNGLTNTGRQAWKFKAHHSKKMLYFGDFEPSPKSKELLGFWTRPSIFMPRAASRIAIEIFALRFERLQDISAEECRREGVQLLLCDGELLIDDQKFSPDRYAPRGLHPRDWSREECWRWHFAAMWDSINEASGFGWDRNPWVWVRTFGILRAPRSPFHCLRRVN
jgi:hypothetical protein